MFSYLFNGLNQAGVIDAYRSVNRTLLIALDGIEYFSSSAIHCPHCSTRTHANGQVTYFHTALTPVLVKPGMEQVIPLAPEWVRPQDGAAKQDCELNAAKRWLATCGSDYRALRVTLLGDDLYAHEPFCQAVLDQGMNFILVCKPTSHPLTYDMNGWTFSTGVGRCAPSFDTAGPVAGTKSTPIARRKPSLSAMATRP